MTDEDKLHGGPRPPNRQFVTHTAGYIVQNRIIDGTQNVTRRTFKFGTVLCPRGEAHASSVRDGLDAPAVDARCREFRQGEIQPLLSRIEVSHCDQVVSHPKSTVLWSESTVVKSTQFTIQTELEGLFFQVVCFLCTFFFKLDRQGLTAVSPEAGSSKCQCTSKGQ